MPDSSGAYDLGGLSSEEKERLEKMADETPDSVKSTDPNALFAFAVIADMEGNVAVYGDVINDSVVPMLKPNNDIVAGACAAVIKDVEASETAQATVQLQLAQAQAIQAQHEAAQQAARLGDLRGGARG